jgi:1,2-diacylglycerol 3-beta-galactosyltransferase
MVFLPLLAVACALRAEPEEGSLLEERILSEAGDASESKPIKALLTMAASASAMQGTETTHAYRMPTDVLLRPGREDPKVNRSALQVVSGLKIAEGAANQGYRNRLSKWEEEAEEAVPEHLDPEEIDPVNPKPDPSTGPPKSRLEHWAAREPAWHELLSLDTVGEHLRDVFERRAQVRASLDYSDAYYEDRVAAHWSAAPDEQLAWARQEAPKLLERHGYFNLRYDPVFGPFLRAAERVGADAMAAAPEEHRVSKTKAQAGLFGLNHMYGCSLPVPGLDRLTEIVVTEALRLMVADFSPEFVARADRTLAAYDADQKRAAMQKKEARVRSSIRMALGFGDADHETPPPEPPPPPKRILFLISDTGGGHRASANALKDAMDELVPGGTETEILDIWTEEGCRPFRKMSEGYRAMSTGGFIGRTMWRSMYYLTPFFEKPWSWDMRLRCGGRFHRRIEGFNPDLVVSLHPMTQALPLTVLETMGRQAGHGSRQIPFATVCTDLGGAHPGWFDKRANQTFVASDRLERMAKRRGVAPERITNHGLPVRRTFWTSSKRTGAAPASEYKALGLNRRLKTVLVVGGGDGAGSLERIVRSLAAELSKSQPGKVQVVAVCGNNERLRARLAAEDFGADVSVHVVGFTKQMSEYMEVADVLVTKAGPGTIAEAAIRGLPSMLSSHLPGQEAGNVPYVVDAGFGEYRNRPRKLAQKVTEWLGDDELLAKMRANAQATAKPEATQDIARDLLRMMDVEPQQRSAPLQVLRDWGHALLGKSRAAEEPASS